MIVHIRKNDPFMYIGIGLTILVGFMLIFTKSSIFDDDGHGGDDGDDGRTKRVMTLDGIYNDSYDTVNTKPCVQSKKQKSALRIIDLPEWMLVKKQKE